MYIDTTHSCHRTVGTHNQLEKLVKKFAPAKRRRKNILKLHFAPSKIRNRSMRQGCVSWVDYFIVGKFFQNQNISKSGSFWQKWHVVTFFPDRKVFCWFSTFFKNWGNFCNLTLTLPKNQTNRCDITNDRLEVETF